MRRVNLEVSNPYLLFPHAPRVHNLPHHRCWGLYNCISEGHDSAGSNDVLHGIIPTPLSTVERYEETRRSQAFFYAIQHIAEMLLKINDNAPQKACEALPGMNGDLTMKM